MTGPCDANPSFRPVASGGDGADVQFCKLERLCATQRHLNGPTGYVGYDAALDTVIAAHQGTDAAKMYAPC